MLYATEDLAETKPDSNVDSETLQQLYLQDENAFEDLDVAVKEEFPHENLEEMLLDYVLSAKKDIPNQINIKKNPKADRQNTLGEKHSECKVVIKINSDSPTSAPTSQPENNKSINYFCKACNEKTGDYRNNMKHHLLFHGRKKNPKLLINFWSEPDVADENFICIACARKYNDNQGYRRHLTDVHFMPLKSGLPCKQRARKSQPGFHPKLDESNLYCRDCNKFFATAALHRYHLTSAHKDRYVCNVNELPDWRDPHDYCRSCDMTYSSVPAFHRHCQTVHKMNGKGPFTPSEDMQLPDPLDPHFYCKACDKHSADLKLFRYHCRYVHLMDLNPTTMGPEANQDLMPDVNDQHNRCQACDKAFLSRKRYLTHLRLYHKINTKSAQKNIEPDPFDVNNHCRSCEKIFKNKILFRSHLRRAHGIYQNPQ